MSSGSSSSSSSSSSRRQRAFVGVHHHVLDYLKRRQAEDSAFFYAIQGGETQTQHSSNIFWADSSFRSNYNHFGDTVRFEALSSSYRANGCNLPFAAFTGINHHAQPVLFGCALILDESDLSASYVWLLRTWLHAMSGNPPVSITIDPDRLLHMAVAQVLPQTRLRFCRWSVFAQTKQELAHVYSVHPSFDVEFMKCVNEAETVEEFESGWGSILEKFHLVDNDWLQSMYNARRQWVPAYLRGIFFGELSFSAGGSDAISSFFDGFVSASTTIQVLVKQYENAIMNWHEKELKADLDTNNSTPLLKTPSPMEKQAASVYTRRIFIKFQEELVDTLANPATKIDDVGTVASYRVAKFGEEHKPHLVRYNALEMKYDCSCQMFEFSGLICRHVLSVFKAKNVLTLPSQYVLKRWTRNARRGDNGVLDEIAPDIPTNSRESLTLRYNNLRQEAIKFVEEGAKSIHIYNVASNALQEATNKVAAAKRKSFGTVPGSCLENGGSKKAHSGEGNQAANCQSTVEKEKKIRELTAELECVNRRSEVYRANLLAVLRDMEDQKLKLSVKIQNARLSLKD